MNLVFSKNNFDEKKSKDKLIACVNQKQKTKKTNIDLKISLE